MFGENTDIARFGFEYIGGYLGSGDPEGLDARIVLLGYQRLQVVPDLWII